MLVYVHSCAMAQAICELVQALAQDLRWIGLAQEAMEDLIQKMRPFLPHLRTNTMTLASLQGRIRWMSWCKSIRRSEGFDSKPVCVILDLSLSGFGPQKLQQYGRGTRYYYGLPLVIYVPTDSAIAPLAYLMSGIFDLPIDTKIPGPTSESSPEPRWSPAPAPMSLMRTLLAGMIMTLHGRKFWASRR